MMEDISREQLLLDLYRAYKDARKHKRSRRYQTEFEYDLESNLISLRDDLYNRTYTPKPSTCFIIHDPKMREVFAADFRDRIVHHLFYNYTYDIFESVFIRDSYSCLIGRGTHDGIKRLLHHILSESQNYNKPCYVMKIDVRGYFMHIRQEKLLEISRRILLKRKCRYPSFVDYLLETIIHTDPKKDCIMVSDKSEWLSLPDDKSLFKASPGCGLPIGNLSSQLFSNVYMNEFDQYCKRVLKCKHYGRYVDDAFFVSKDREWLLALRQPVQQFLIKELGLSLNCNKTQIVNVWQGVEFLGAFIKPYRIYPSTSSFRRMKHKILALQYGNTENMQSVVNSYLGIFGHYNSYCLRRVLFDAISGLSKCGYFSREWLKFYCT